MILFSFKRVFAMIVKEFIQIRRDRITFAMLLVIPLFQLIIFGYAINSNPRNLPTGVISYDHSSYTRTFIAALQNTKYFKITQPNINETQANQMLADGRLLFVINIPANFTHDLIRDEKPDILVTADATDPTAMANALGTIRTLANQVFNLDIEQQGLNYLSTQSAPFNLIVHAKYNPESISQYNIVPGLMGVVLTMTLVLVTGLAITRERERGTMENLLATPIRPSEVIIGKITPFILTGYSQVLLIIIVSLLLFQIPFIGSFWLLILATLPFVLANLSVGILFSTIAKNQLQAMQMTFFFFLPSILLSGFMFPFQGMPNWAQYLGEILPLTHFLRIVRGILLKGNGFTLILPELWPILVFMIIVLTIALFRYRQTLD